MKKNFFFWMAAIVMLIMSSCQQEAGFGTEATVSFQVGTPEIATRAYSDGTTATVLQYAVYDENGQELTDLTRSVATQNAETINIEKEVNLQLTTGNTYSVIFWAAAQDAPYSVDFANKTMTVDYSTAVSNDENRDAFYKHHTFTVTGAQTEIIELRRPFAQLNIGTSDYEASKSAGYEPKYSSVKVSNVYNTLDLVEGKVSGATAVVYSYNVIPTNEAFPVTGYEYLAMNYLLVASEKEVVDVEFGYTELDATAAKTRTVGSVPVQRNYRTNIYGQLLTSNVDVNVIIEPEYEEPAYEADALLLAAAVGGEVTLTDDVVLTEPLVVKHGVIINLDGHTISGNWHKDQGAVIKVEADVTAKFVGGTISSIGNNGGSAIQNYGTAIVEGTTLNGAPREGTGKTDYPAYPINNYGSMILTEANITGYHGCVALNAAGTTTLNNCELTKNYEKTSSHVFYVNHEDAKVIINGGTYNHNGFDGSLAYVNKGEVTINGGAFNAKDGGYGFAVLSAGKVTINGGNINAALQDWGGQFVVNGGIYTAKPADKYLAVGYKALQISNNKYMIVPTNIDAYCNTENTNLDGVTYTGDAFASGPMDNTLWINKYLFGEDAAIKVVDKTYGAIIIENCIGNLKNDVITIDNTNNSVMILQNLDLTLAEGKKLIKSTNTIYQVFMANITINGEKQTTESIAQYLENVGWYQVVEEI